MLLNCYKPNTTVFIINEIDGGIWESSLLVYIIIFNDSDDDAAAADDDNNNINHNFFVMS